MNAHRKRGEDNYVKQMYVAGAGEFGVGFFEGGVSHEILFGFG